MAKKKEPKRALGIPDRSKFFHMPVTRDILWTGNIQSHKAERAGKHFDLRLNDPKTSHAYSWAVRNLPAPGEKTLAIEQPTHTKNYMGWSGVIDSGYGKGTVNSVFHDKVEVLESSPDRITFNVYGPGQKVSRYMLMRMDGKDWLLYNYTATTSTPLIPDYKRSYKEIEYDKVETNRDDEWMAPKMDGAHNTVLLRPEKRVDVYSHRLSKKGPERIDHSYRTDLYKEKSPKDLGVTVLRSELYLPGKESSDVGGLMTANVWDSRSKQKKMGKLQNVIFDVVRYKGKDMEDAPYREKWRILEKINKLIPKLRLPELAKTEEQKKALLRKVKDNLHPETGEGVVIYKLNKSLPIKAKAKSDYDVKIIGTFAAKPGSKYDGNAIGGFIAVPEYDENAQIRVGSGLTDEERRDAWAHGDKYVGQWAKVQGLKKTKTGKIRMPVYKGLRFEKYPGKFFNQN